MSGRIRKNSDGSDAHDAVHGLERRLLPRLTAAKDVLARNYPSFEFNVWSDPLAVVPNTKDMM
jgi:hypothetical protein